MIETLLKADIQYFSEGGTAFRSTVLRAKPNRSSF